MNSVMNSMEDWAFITAFARLLFNLYCGIILNMRTVGALLFLVIVCLMAGQVLAASPDEPAAPDSGEGLFVFLAIDPNEVPKSSVFLAKGEILCKERGCRNVNGYLYYRRDSGSSPILVPSQYSPDHLFYTTSPNPAHCPDLARDNRCFPEWKVIPTKAGNYLMAMRGEASLSSGTRSSNAIENYTGDVPVVVMPGIITPEIMSIAPFQINIGGSVVIQAQVSCSIADCSHVSVYLRSNGMSVPSLGNGITTQDANPQVCESLAAGSSCLLEWSVSGNEVGVYALTVYAASKDSEIMPAESGPDTLNVQSPSPEPGDLSVTSVTMQPNPINIGGATMLSGDITCSTSYCGSVSAHARHGGQDIGNAGPLAMQDQNPITCLSLPCSASWDITANGAGNFLLEMLAVSGDNEVGSASGTGTLIVQEPGGNGTQELLDIEVLQKSENVLRGDDFFASVRVIMDNALVLQAQVTARSDIFLYSLFDDGLHEDAGAGDGVYAGRARVQETASAGIHSVVVKAEKGLLNGSASFGFSVKPELYVSIYADRAGYQTLERATVRGSVLKAGRPAKASMGFELKCGSYRETLGSIETDAFGNFVFQFGISALVPPGPCTITATATDSFRNTGSGSIGVSIGKSEGQKHEIVFLSPAEDELFDPGETVSISIRVMQNGQPVTGTLASCTNPYGNPVFLEEMQGGVYSVDYTLPSEGLPNSWLVSCLSQKGGFFGNGNTEVRIRAEEIGIKLLSPQQTSFFVGEFASFVVQLTYSDGTPVQGANVSMRLQDRTIGMKEGAATGTYQTIYEFTEEGLLLFEIAAEDASGSRSTKDVYISSKIRDIEILIPLVIFFLGLLGSALIWARRKPVRIVEKVVYGGQQPVQFDPKAEIEAALKRLEARKITIEKAKDVAESAYYKRNIDEKTFRKMMTDYEEELIKINVEIIDLKRGLSKYK